MAEGGMGYGGYASLISGVAEGLASAFEGQVEARNILAKGRAARGEAYLKAARIRKKGEAILSAQRAAYASGGIKVGTGTPLLVAKNTAEDIERDVLMTKYAGEQALANAKNAAFQSRIGGISSGFFSIAGGAGKAAGSAKANQSKAEKPMLEDQGYKAEDFMGLIE